MVAAEFGALRLPTIKG